MVTRTPIDNSADWFDLDRATKWDSTVGGGEVLYQTHRKGWVLYTGLFKAIPEEQAVSWLIRNEHDVPPDAEGTASEIEY